MRSGLKRWATRLRGVDFSRRSIDYATASAARQGKAITYHYQDYLKMNLEKKFDLAMIYCDYGALSDDDRRTLLSNVRRHLRPGGKVPVRRVFRRPAGEFLKSPRPGDQRTAVSGGRRATSP